VFAAFSPALCSALKHTNSISVMMQESESIAEDSGTEAGSVVEG